MPVTNFDEPDRLCHEWAQEQVGGQFYGWHTRVFGEWNSGVSEVLADYGIQPTLREAISFAVLTDGVLILSPSGYASGGPSRSIPFLHGIHGRTRGRSLVEPTRVWPDTDREELARSLGCDPSSLELWPPQN